MAVQINSLPSSGCSGTKNAKLNEIHAIAALKERVYSNFGQKENISYVAAHACKRLLLLSEEHLDSKDYKAAQAVYDKVEDIIKKRNKDKRVAEIDACKEPLKLRLEAYNTQKKKEVLQKMLPCYGLQLHQSAIAAMKDLNSRKYINFTLLFDSICLFILEG